MWINLITVLLEKVMKGDLYTLSELQDITVYHPANFHGSDVQRRILHLEKNESCELECLNYLTNDPRQEVAGMLTQMASREHRNVLVRYEQMSQYGYSSRRETAAHLTKAASQKQRITSLSVQVN